MLKKTINVLAYTLVLVTLLMVGCEKENLEPQDNSQLTDLKSQLLPATSQELPSIVQEQLNVTRENLNKYMNGNLQIEDLNVLGTMASEKSLEVSNSVVSNKNAYVASGNIMEPALVAIGKMSELYTSKELYETKDAIKQFASHELKVGDEVLEITWRKGDETFKTHCFYRESGIVWDNILTGLFIMDPEPKVEETQTEKSIRGKAFIVDKSYSRKWVGNWIWGTKRGEMGYKITIYYNLGSSTVNNTDVEDWAYITLGKAKSYSEIVKNSGSYGKCRYALGLCTPVGSLSFDKDNFKVEFKGLGSNIVANGTKSLYP